MQDASCQFCHSPEALVWEVRHQALVSPLQLRLCERCKAERLGQLVQTTAVQVV